MITEFTEVLLVLKIFLLSISEDWIEELTFSIGLIGAYGVLRYFLKNIEKRIHESHAVHFVRLLAPVSFYGITAFLIIHLPAINSLYILLSIFYILVLITLAQSFRSYVPLGFPSYVAVNLSIFASAVMVFFQNISKTVNPLLSGSFFTYFKLFSAIIITIVLIRLYVHILEHLKDSLPGRIVKRSGLPLFVVYVAVTASWTVGTVEFSQDFVVKLAVLVGLLFGYMAILVYTVITIEKFFGGVEGALSLVESFRRFMYILAFLVLYRGIDFLFSIGQTVGKLREVYVIKTELVEISVLSLLEGIYLFVLLVSLTSFMKHAVYVYYMRKDKEIEAGSLRSLISNIGFLLAVSFALVELGITWKVMVPIAGALGIGIGFGLQTIFNNYISGFILLLSKNIKVGDLVELEGSAGRAIGRSGETIFGKVVNINILTTVIRTTDNVEIAIPNSEFVSGKIINYSLSDPYIRVRIPFGVSYTSDPEKVREVLLRVAQESPLVLKTPRPSVWFYEMADSSLVFYLLVWVDIRKFWRMKALKSEIYFNAWRELKKEGIEIPFPQRDLWFRSPLKVEIDEGKVPERSSKRSKKGT